MFGYATASPMAAQIATPSNNATPRRQLSKPPRNRALAKRAPPNGRRGRHGARDAGSFAGVLSGSLMNVGRDVSADYRNRQVSLKPIMRVPSKSTQIADMAIVRADSTISYGDQMPVKIRAFPHTNFVFLSFLLIGLPQNINPALTFERCRSMSSCQFSTAFSAASIRP